MDRSCINCSAHCFDSNIYLASNSWFHLIHSTMSLACMASRGQSFSETLWFCPRPWSAKFPSITSWRIPYPSQIDLTAWKSVTGRKDLRTRLSLLQQTYSQWWMLKARVTSTYIITHIQVCTSLSFDR